MAADAKLLAQIELVGDIEEWIVDANCDPDCDAYRGPNGSACARCEALFIAAKLTGSGRLMPSQGEVSNSPRGLGNIEYARRIADRLYRDLWQSKPSRDATALHARVLVEKELDAIAAEIWGSPVVSDNSEGDSDG